MQCLKYPKITTIFKLVRDFKHIPFLSPISSSASTAFHILCVFRGVCRLCSPFAGSHLSVLYTMRHMRVALSQMPQEKGLGLDRQFDFMAWACQAT